GLLHSFPTRRSSDLSPMMVAVVALNIAEVAAIGTMTEAGTVSVGLLLVSVTLVPPAGAALLSVMVQELKAFCPRVVGVQARLVRSEEHTSELQSLAY